MDSDFDAKAALTERLGHVYIQSNSASRWIDHRLAALEYFSLLPIRASELRSERRFTA
jgi:hypothetical protein